MQCPNLQTTVRLNVDAFEQLGDTIHDQILALSPATAMAGSPATV
jgi:hypothetical protein